MEHTHINSLHAKVKYMGKTLYGKYFEAECNIRLDLPVCVAREVCVSTSYLFQAILFTTFQTGATTKEKTI